MTNQDSPPPVFWPLVPEGLDPELSSFESSESLLSSLSAFTLSTPHMSANQFWICTSVFWASPSGQMSSHTPLKPSLKPATLLSSQKHFSYVDSSPAGPTGGTQAPLAS